MNECIVCKVYEWENKQILENEFRGIFTLSTVFFVVIVVIVPLVLVMAETTI